MIIIDFISVPLKIYKKRSRQHRQYLNFTDSHFRENSSIYGNTKGAKFQKANYYGRLH